MTAPVATIDFDAVYAEITERLAKDKERRLLPPLIRLWDGDWNLRGTVKQEISASFQWINNETGVGTLEMPLDYYLSKWLAGIRKRKLAGEAMNVNITVDKDGARWDGLLDELQVLKDNTGKKYVRCTFKHSYEHLKHILCWSNPFLPAEIQFPRLWVLFGKSRWCLKTTAFVNILRLEASLWMLPDDPMNLSNWFNLDQSTWSMVVAPEIKPDTSVGALVHSRFKSLHEVSKSVAADAQLTWTFRRYLNGDEPPWEGADLRHGCLVIDLEEKSGWNTGTSFFGDLFSGLIHAFFPISMDGYNEGTETLPDPNMPPEYYLPGWKGTLPKVPGVIFREGENTSIQSSEFSWKPATDVGAVAGGHSMPGVNELISAAVQMAGDLTAMIPGLPPLGGAADAILSPLYTDTILAFGKWKDIFRAQELGWSHYHEKWADGADRAYTLAYLLAMRTAMWTTREQTRHVIEVAEGGQWSVGDKGRGHFFIGDRVGSVPLGIEPGSIFVDQVTELVLSWNRETTPFWKITIGSREPEDPVIKLFERMQEAFGLLRDLGLT